MDLFSVLVTGASRGIGLEFIRQLVKLPSPPKHVFAACRKPEDAKEVVFMLQYLRPPSDMELFSVFVTGANRGIGLEFTRQLVKLPSPPKHIFAACRKPEDAKNLHALRDSTVATKIHLLKMDVTNTKEIEAAAKIVEETVGDNGLTFLFNNAGVAQLEEFPNMTVETTNFHLSVNTIGPVMVAQAMLPMLKKAASRQAGSRMSFSRAGILNMTSMAGCIHNTGYQFTQDLAVPAYKMSKAALNMAMRVIAAKVKDDNILVILMCPGWVKTDMGTDQGQLEPHESISAILSTAAKLNEFHHGTYMDRLGNPYPW